MSRESTQRAKATLTPRVVVELGFGQYRLTGRSALTGELVRLSPRVHRVLSVTPIVIAVLDLLITAARLATDDADVRPLSERMEELFEQLPKFDDPQVASLMSALLEKAAGFAEDPEAQQKVELYLKRFTSANYLRVARRLLGAAAYDRIQSAFDNDAAAVLIAVRRLTRHLMPFAVAIDDCIAVLTPEQLAEAEVFSPEQGSLLQIGLMIDTFFDDVFDGRLRQHFVTSRPDEQRAWDIGDLEAIAEKLHEVLKGRTHETLEQLSARLARKVRGARDAMEGSADAASQAANSLIEFIDRVLRDAFGEEFVLDWLGRNRPNDRSLTYFDAHQKKVRPTKRGQALCFIFAGQDSAQPMPLHETIASSLNETRRGLQKIKHADTGSEEELKQLHEFMASVEGFVLYAVRFGWATVQEDRLGMLKDRLAGEAS
jgi:hypothetical protein